MGVIQHKKYDCFGREFIVCHKSFKFKRLATSLILAILLALFLNIHEQVQFCINDFLFNILTITFIIM